MIYHDNDIVACMRLMAKLTREKKALYDALEQAVQSVAPSQPLCGELLTAGLHCQKQNGHSHGHFAVINGEWLFAAIAALAKARGEQPK